MAREKYSCLQGELVNPRIESEVEIILLLYLLPFTVLLDIFNLLEVTATDIYFVFQDIRHSLDDSDLLTKSNKEKVRRKDKKSSKSKESNKTDDKTHKTKSSKKSK